MIQIKYVGKTKKPEKKYKIATVAFAIGCSESAIGTYFSNRGISVKGGITLDQIVEVIGKVGVRWKSVIWDDIYEIRNRLQEEHGILITESEDESEE